MRIRALIVDDEPPAREKLRTLLRHEPDIDLAGECADGQSAVEAILRLEPDLVFLDVEMPGIDGFDVIDAIGPYHVPAVVFVATQGAAAVRVLEIHALEVLLKPFDHARFSAALTWLSHPRCRSVWPRSLVLLDLVPIRVPLSRTPIKP